MGKDANIGIFRVGEALIGHTTSVDEMDSRDLAYRIEALLLVDEHNSIVDVIFKHRYVAPIEDSGGVMDSILTHRLIPERDMATVLETVRAHKEVLIPEVMLSEDTVLALKGLKVQEILEATDLSFADKRALVKELMDSADYGVMFKTKIGSDGFYLLDTLLADKDRTTSADSIHGAETLPVHKLKFTEDGGLMDEAVYAMKGAFIRDVLDAQDGLLRDRSTTVQDSSWSMEIVKMTRIVMMLDITHAADRFLAGKAITLTDASTLEDLHRLAKEAIIQEVMHHLESSVMAKQNIARDGMAHADKSLADVNTTVREYVGMWENQLIDKVLQVAEQTLATDNTLTFKTMFEVDGLEGIDASVFFKLKMTAEDMAMVDGFEIPFRTVVVAENTEGVVQIRRGAPFAIVSDGLLADDVPKVDKWMDVGDALIALELPIGARALDLVKCSFRDTPTSFPFMLHQALIATLYVTETVQAYHSISETQNTT